MMESANYSILITDFLRFGKIPLVHHYGGHMMTDVWEGILYGILNHDFAGAAFSPYREMILVVIALCQYWLIQWVWNRDAAFWATLVLPITSDFKYYGLGLLIAIAMLAFIKKNTWPRAVLFWLVCVWVVTYRLDLGAAFLVAVFAALAYWLLTQRNIRALKQLLVTLGGVALVFGGAWCLLCLADGVNPVSRLIEFIHISASNRHWAVGALGNTKSLLMVVAYLVIPLAVILLLGQCVCSHKLKNQVKLPGQLLLILIGTTYLANFQRSLTRHTLSSGMLPMVFFSAFLFLALFIALRLKRQLFLPAFFGLTFLCTGLFIGNGTAVSPIVMNRLNLVSVADCAVERMGPFMERWDRPVQEQQIVQRLVWSDELTAELRPFEEITNTLLEQDETYIDLRNNSFSYSALGRQAPMYVSQSPMQLSGEFTQECFIQQIQRNLQKNPIVLLPHKQFGQGWAAANLDALPNAFRHYKVAEYVWQNFVPLCSDGDFAVWCLPERKEEMLKAIEQKRKGDRLPLLLDHIEEIAGNQIELLTQPQGLMVHAVGADPYLSGLEVWMDLADLSDSWMDLEIGYTSDMQGTLQLFYTTAEGEGFSTEKTQAEQIDQGSGKVKFCIPVTSHTQLRLDLPENSTVVLTSVQMNGMFAPIDYGYDRVVETQGTCELLSEEQDSLHIYELNSLPRLWAEMDERKAVDGTVLAELSRQEDCFVLQEPTGVDKTKGNYLLVTAELLGGNWENAAGPEDEEFPALLRMGRSENGIFKEYCRYGLTLLEGTHQYLIRLSDYQWFQNQIDTVILETDQDPIQISMKVLQGD